MKRLFISAIAMMLSAGLMAQDVKRPDSYNYTRGVEAIQNNNMDEGVEFLQKELAENPKNGYAYGSGASNVSMSSVEATFMFKNGYLQQQDVQGKQNFITADGNISEGTVINLRNVEFGGMKLTNIKASIVKNQRAPLLLGQSILKRLGKIEIDNEKRLLKIPYKEKNNHK